MLNRLYNFIIKKVCHLILLTQHHTSPEHSTSPQPALPFLWRYNVSSWNRRWPTSQSLISGTFSHLFKMCNLCTWPWSINITSIFSPDGPSGSFACAGLGLGTEHMEIFSSPVNLILRLSSLPIIDPTNPGWKFDGERISEEDFWSVWSSWRHQCHSAQMPYPWLTTSEMFRCCRWIPPCRSWSSPSHSFKGQFALAQYCILELGRQNILVESVYFPLFSHLRKPLSKNPLNAPISQYFLPFSSFFSMLVHSCKNLTHEPIFSLAVTISTPRWERPKEYCRDPTPNVRTDR